MFEKVKRFIAHAFDTHSVQVELTANPIPQNASLATGKIRLTAYRDVHIDKLEVQMIEQRVTQYLVPEKDFAGEHSFPHRSRISATEIGRVVDNQAFDLKAGQTHEAPFEVLFQRRQNFAQDVRDELGEGAGVAAAVLTNVASTSSEYHLRAYAHVRGTLISPNAGCAVQFV